MSDYKIALPHNAYNFGGDSVETTVTINVGEGFEKILTFNYKNLDTGDFYSIEGTPDNIEYAFLRNVDTLPSGFSSTVSDYLAQVKSHQDTSSNSLSLPTFGDASNFANFVGQSGAGYKYNQANIYNAITEQRNLTAANINDLTRQIELKEIDYNNLVDSIGRTNVSIDHTQQNIRDIENRIAQAQANLNGQLTRIEANSNAWNNAQAQSVNTITEWTRAQSQTSAVNYNIQAAFPELKTSQVDEITHLLSNIKMGSGLTFFT